MRRRNTQSRLSKLDLNSNKMINNFSPQKPQIKYSQKQRQKDVPLILNVLLSQFLSKPYPNSLNRVKNAAVDQQRPSDEINAQELIKLDDFQLLRKYHQDIFFQSKLDFRMRMFIQSNGIKNTTSYQTQNSYYEQEKQPQENRIDSMYSLRRLKNKQNYYLSKLYEKYQRIISHKNI